MKQLTNKLLPVIMAVAILLSLGITAGAADPYDAKLNIVHTNDTHGYVDVYAYAKGLASQLRAKGEEVVMADAGDVVNGTSFGMYNNGLAVIDVMNLAGYDLFTLGNHEQFLTAAQYTAIAEASEFPHLGANINDSFREAGDIKDYWIYDFDGLKLAFLGLTTGSYTDRSADEAVAALETAKAAAQAEGATVFIGVFHLGITDASPSLRSTYIAEKCPWLSAIIDAHCHTSYQNTVNGVYMVETGEYGDNLGLLEIYFKDGKVAQISSKNIAIAGNEASCGITPDPDITAYIAKVRKELAHLEETVMTLPVALNGERENVRSRETVIGDIMCDAILSVCDADFAVFPGVFIRRSVDAGAVSRATFQTMFLKTETELYLLERTGEQVLAFLETILDGVPEVSGSFRQLGGIVLRYDETKPVGSRVVSVTMSDGSAPDPAKTYVMACTDMEISNLFGDDWQEQGLTFPEVKTDANTAFLEYINGGKVKSWTTDGRIASVNLPFTDVESGSWYYDAVKYVYTNGLFEGMSGTSFAPDTPMNRAMLVTVLWRADGAPAVTAANPFTDVNDGQWFTGGVVWASEKEIADGYGDGIFGPADDLTREQAAAILYRYAKYLELDVSARDDLSGFIDAASVSGWALEAMRWAVGEGIIRGDGGVLDPEGPASRAQTAAILMRFMEAA